MVAFSTNCDYIKILFLVSGSLSSHSSRDPSPIPSDRHGENLSSSSPNLAMTNTQPSHQRSHPYQHSSTPPVMNTSSHRDSPGMVLNTSQHRIIQHPVGQSVSSMYNAPVIPPSLVTRNTGQSKSVGGLQSASSPQVLTGSPFPPAEWSNRTMTSSSRQVAPLETGSQPVSYSQEVVSQNVVSRNIPSQFNQSNQQQRLETSHLPPNIHPQNLESSSNRQNFDGRSGPPQNLSAGVSYAPPYMQTSPSVISGPPLQHQSLSRQGTGLPHQSIQGQNSTMSSPVPRTNAQSFVRNQLVNRPTSQSGPAFGVLMPGPPVGSSTTQQPMQPSPMGQHMSQPGILSPKGSTQTQPGMPPVTGDVQKPPPSMGYPQPPMPNQFPVPPQLGTTQYDSGHHFGKRYPQQVSYVLEIRR